MLDLPSFCTKMPPEEWICFGQPRPIIQRTVSYMWMHMSPTMPLLYSLNVRHHRRCGSGSLPYRSCGGASYGRMGAGPVHIS